VGHVPQDSEARQAPLGSNDVEHLEYTGASLMLRLLLTSTARAWQGKAGGTARHGTARPGTARHGTGQPASEGRAQGGPGAQPDSEPEGKEHRQGGPGLGRGPRGCQRAQGVGPPLPQGRAEGKLRRVP
jgi:hypothetical protein